MATPAEQVDAAFNRAIAYAANAQTATTSFLNALDAAIYTPPTLSLTWESIAAPTLPALPTEPTLPTIEYAAPASTPAVLAIAEPAIDIDDFAEADPVLTLPDAVVVSYGAVPTIPAVAAVTVPDAPTLDAVTAPTFLTLSTITTPTIDLNAAYLENLENIPTLTLLEPTPYSYALGAEYASSLLTTVKAVVEARLAGGTGLDAAVEQAIWDRARDRETRIAQGNIDQVLRTSDALGFQLPAGVVAAQTRDAEQAYFDKLSELSRDISIKQADLEQSNLKDSIAAGMELESKLIDYSYRMEQLAFESAKQYADNAIASYNAQVEKHQAVLEGYKTYALAYKTIIDGQLALVEVYKAQLQGEQTKANINTSLVAQYKASIEAGMAQVEIYRAQVGAAQTLIQLEQTKISAAGEQIRAYVAQINAETAKVEAYKATVQGELAQVEVYKAKVGAFSAKVGAQADKARAEVSRYSALYQAKAAEWDGYKAQVDAEGERIRALGLQSNSLLDGYRASLGAVTAEAEMHSSIWRASMAQYEAGQQITIQTAKINNDAVMMTNNARLDAAKAGAQVYAQLTASAYSMVNASASVSAGSSMSVGFSYSNDTESEAPTTTTV